MAAIPVFHPSDIFGAYQASDVSFRKMDAISTSQNDYDLSLTTTVNPNAAIPRVFKVNASTAVNITGIVAPTGVALDGLPRYLYNDGPSTITLVNASGSSAAANRFFVSPAGAGNFSLTSNSVALLWYDVAATTWIVGLPCDSNAFKVEVPGATEGCIVMLDNAWWSVHNTGFYDAAGSKTANAVDVFYRYGTTVPTQNYASSTAAECASIPLESGRDELIQVSRSNPSIYFIATQANGVTCRFRKNEQGYGLNKRV